MFGYKGLTTERTIRRARLAACIAVALLATCQGAGTVQAATVYVYKNARGSVLITDHARSTPGYTLIKKHHARDRDRDFTDISVLNSKFDDMIERASRSNRIDVALVKAVVHAESAFDADAVSHKGAVGLMQLMSSTAAAYGVADRTDPWQNLLAGTAHLRRLIDLYGDKTLALAAYNAGNDAVRRYGGIPPYPETESYVRKVLRLHELYRQKG